MSSVTLEVNKIYDTLKEQALEQNDRSYGTWSKYKNDLDTTKSLLNLIPKKISHQVMVPLGPKALMPGKIVHTNEFLVNLGETWFVKRTSSQTIEICDRRIKTCDEMLQKLEKERELVLSKSTLPAEQEAFGNEERPEIIEYVTEEEDQEWRKQHKLKEKEYRKKLSELRNREKKIIETEEDLWEHLDQLELQEELEDELNRLNAYNSSDEDVSESSLLDNESREDSDKPNNKLEKTNNKTDNKSDNSRNFKIKRKVSFACDTNLSDEEPLRLEIKHTDSKSVETDPNCTDIISPSDIYRNFLQTIKKSPLSVLKRQVNPNKEKELENVQHEENSSSSDEDFIEEVEKPIMSGIQFNDVIERKTVSVASTRKPGEKINKVSKFKAQRMKNL